MIWVKKDPSRGDIIRIPVGDFFHLGVYVSDDEVIAFGYPPERFLKVDFSKIKVVSTNLEVFKNNQNFEVLELNSNEQKNKNSIELVVDIARSKIGEKNYDPIKNNCEHFVFKCLFNQSISTQINDVRKQVLNIPFLKVYVSKFPFECTNEIYPKSRGEYINSINNKNVKDERFYVWKLLEFALKDSFNLDIKKLDITKNENGVWGCEKVNFSLSHSNGLVCVAVSKHCVGVDIELINLDKVNEKLYKKVLNENEIDLVKEEEDFLSLWSLKEAIFKSKNERVFKPKSINVLEDKNYVLKKLSFNNKKYVLTIYGEDIKKVKYNLSNDIILI